MRGGRVAPAHRAAFLPSFARISHHGSPAPAQLPASPGRVLVRVLDRPQACLRARTCGPTRIYRHLHGLATTHGAKCGREACPVPATPILPPPAARLAVLRHASAHRAFLRLRRGVDILCSAFLTLESRLKRYLSIGSVGISRATGSGRLGNLSIAFTGFSPIARGVRDGRGAPGLPGKTIALSFQSIPARTPLLPRAGTALACW